MADEKDEAPSSPVELLVRRLITEDQAREARILAARK